MRRDCPRSAEVAAVLAGGIGGGFQARGLEADGDLQQHVASCPSCADLALVMTSFQSERDRSRRAATVPSAGLVWWRAQLRQRQAAARTAAAPVTIVHAFTLALALALAVFMAWTVGRSVGLPDVATHLAALPAWFAAAAPDASDSPALVRYGLILAATTWLTLGPVALYFALRRE